MAIVFLREDGDMLNTVAELLDAALSLPETERSELAELIEASLPAPPSFLDPAWSGELRRRVAEIDSGKVELVPWNDVQRQIHAQLDSGEIRAA